MPRPKGKLKPFDITLREIEAIEERQKGIENPNRISLGIFQYPEVAEKILYYRDWRNFEEYCTLLKIRTKDAGTIPFKWKRAQKVFWYNKVVPMIEAGLPVWLYILKARQIGFTTLIDAIEFHKASMFCSIYGSLISHSKDKSAEIFHMTKLFYKTLPPDLRPTRKLSNRNVLFFANPDDDGELGLESLLSIETADNTELGVGSTLQALHLSEFAKYEKVNPDIKNSLSKLFQALPSLPGTFAFIETTAEGEGLGKEVWENEDSGFTNFFVSWVADEKYRIEEHNLETKSLGSSDTSKYGNEIRIRDQVIEEIKKWYPEKADDNEFLLRESLCRLQWRRENISKKCFGNLMIFKQENPLTAEEAFLSTGSPIFNYSKLKALEDIAGQVEPKHYTHQRSTDLLDIGKFLPVDFEGAELKVFEPPKLGHKYYMGVDVGSGVRGVGTKDESDYSVIVGLNHLAEQVFQYRSIIEPTELAYPTVVLSKLYNNAKVNPETNTYGLALIAHLVKVLKFYNIYRRMPSLDRFDEAPTMKLGTYTSRRTRPILLSGLQDGINNGHTLPLDLDTIGEMKTLALIKGKIQAPLGKFDDTVFAYALALYLVPRESNPDSMDELLNRPGTLHSEIQKLEALQYENETLASMLGVN